MKPLSNDYEELTTQMNLLLDIIKLGTRISNGKKLTYLRIKSEQK